MGFWQYASFGTLLALGLAGIVYLVAVPALRLLPRYWRERLRWLLVALAGLFAIWSSMYLLTQFGHFNVYLEPYPRPGMHACGGPYVEGAAACEQELFENWLRETGAVRNRYSIWISTPPSLRQPCEWVTDDLCALIERNPIVGSWAQYMGLILAYAESVLACVFVMDWLFWRTGTRKKKKNSIISFYLSRLARFYDRVVHNGGGSNEYRGDNHEPTQRHDAGNRT